MSSRSDTPNDPLGRIEGPGASLPYTSITGGREIEAARRKAEVQATFKRAADAQNEAAYEQAARLYHEIIALVPNHALSLANLGVVLRELGRAEEAFERLQSAIALQPNDLSMVRRFAAWCVDDGQHERALPLLRALLQANPKNFDLYQIIMAVVRPLQRSAELLDFSRHGVIAMPERAECHVWLGEALALGGREREAAAAFKTAIDLDPNCAVAWAGLGAIHAISGNPKRAITLLDKAESIKPSAQAQVFMAGSWLQLGRFQDAESASRTALTRDPKSLLGRRHLVEALAARSCPEEATEAIRPLLDGPQKAEFRFVDALIEPVIPPDRYAIDLWRNRIDQHLDAILSDPLPLTQLDIAMTLTNFRLAYHGRDDKPLQRKTAAALLASAPSLAAARPAPAPAGKIRIGLISHFFTAHTVAVLNGGLVEYLDRDRFHVTAFLFPAAESALRTIYRAHADRVVELPTDFESARRLIAAVDLDLLYYCDIGMSPLTYLLAFSRLAPVQCVTWGHPDTTGIPTIDYFVSCDAMEPPDAVAHYSERLVRISGPTVHVERVELPETKPRSAFGLPDDAHLYVCPQSLFKLHPDFDAVVGSILMADPLAQIVLLRGKDPNHEAILFERMRRSANPDMARIRVLPHQNPVDFVNVIALSDVMLDPLHYSGGKTTLEAFSMAVPVVTWPGEFMRGRHTHGFYKLMGMHRTTARDWDDYVRIAVSLGTDADARRSASEEIVAKRDILYRNVGTIRALEEFFAAAVAAARRGGSLS